MKRKGLEPILSEHESDELPITQSLLPTDAKLKILTFFYTFLNLRSG